MENADRAGTRRHRSGSAATFRNEIRAGKIDSADGFAALLIPNVREWYADRSNCGPGGDGDGPPMPNNLVIAETFIGSELAGFNSNLLEELVSASFVRAAIPPYRHDCSAEFRAVFARRLRAAAPRSELNSALLSLSWEGERRSGLYRFVDAGRITRPVLAWPEVNASGDKFLIDQHQPVTRTLEDFWREAVPRLSSPALTCPEAYERLVVTRDVELERLRKTPKYLRLVARLEIERKQR